MKVIDLFAGAGGLSEGFRQAGFEIIAHVEMDKSACNTLKTREAYYYLKSQDNLTPYIDYLTKKITRDQLYSLVPNEILKRVIEIAISEQTIPSIESLISERLEQYDDTNIDLIIGGPPCQAFSTAGISRDPNRMKDDPRNYLYKHYVEFLQEYRPKMFIFENVKGIINAQKGAIFDNLQQMCADIGYEVDYKILNAKNFGVAQNRERVILIGWKQDYSLQYPDFDLVDIPIPINQLLDDLPALKAGESIEGVSKYNNNKNTQIPFIRSKNWDILTQHITRKHNENDLNIYKLVVEAWDKERRILKYNELPENIRTHKNIDSFLDRYKSLKYDNVSHTVVAHISKDGHYYIHPDIQQNRSISVREAARLQSFPDDFYFEDSRTAAFKQIGNAVPPLMAFKIAEKIRDILRHLE